jgi:hypothetical protein
MSRIARFLLTLTSISAAVLANAQGTFQLFPTLESPVGELTPQTAVLRFTQNVTLMDYGIRVSPANGVAQIRMSTQPGSPLSASQGEAIWQGGPFFVGSRAVLRPLVQMKPDFVGTATITFFARTPGTTTDLISSSVVVSVGQLPAPTMAVPIANETISPAPAFRGQLATVYPQTASYQVEVTGPTNRTFTIPAGATNADFTHYTAYDAGYQPGDYTWRIRAIDARGRAGIWSAPRSNRIFGGIDMAGLGTQAFFNSMRAAGWSTYFAAAWGGRNIWSPAAQNLQRANAAGMKVAAYAFLNFDNSSTIAGAPANQTGQWQVDQGLRACGYVGTKASLPFDLKYFMIDIENSYVGTMAPVDRAQRIAEAVQHARNLGFWPMIYTRNEGFNSGIANPKPPPLSTKIISPSTSASLGSDTVAGKNAAANSTTSMSPSSGTESTSTSGIQPSGTSTRPTPAASTLAPPT